MDPGRLLAASGSLELATSSAFGLVLLARLQRAAATAATARGAAKAAPAGHRDIVAAHVDAILLGLAQLGAAFVLTTYGARHATWAAPLLVFGGWLNPFAYLARAMGLDVFVFAGSPGQRLGSAVAGLGSLAVGAGWVLVTLSVILGA